MAVEIPRSVTAFDQTVIAEKFQPFLELTKGLGGPLVDQVSQCPGREWHSLLIAFIAGEAPGDIVH